MQRENETLSELNEEYLNLIKEKYISVSNLNEKKEVFNLRHFTNQMQTMVNKLNEMQKE